MSTLESPGSTENSLIKRPAPENKKLKERVSFDLERPPQSPEFYEVHKHIENLLASLSKPKIKVESTKIKEDDDTFKKLDTIHIEAEQKEKERKKKIATNVVDFVPIVGSVKMILEGMRGKQYGTEKEIKGFGRLAHTVAGAVFLSLDVAGVVTLGTSTAAAEAGKGFFKIGEHALLGAVEKSLIREAGEQVVVKTVEEKLLSEAIKKESKRLIARGELRIEKKEKIADGA